MNTLRYLLLGLIALPSALQCQPALIPFPTSYMASKDEFVVDNSVVILYGDLAAAHADYLKAWYQTNIGLTVVSKPIEEGAPAGGKFILLNCGPHVDVEEVRKAIPQAPNLKLDAAMLRSSNEDYTMGITSVSMVLNGNGPEGLFYAIQTLIQLSQFSYSGNGKTLSVACAQIQDRPAFSHRGMLLDCCRHFMPVELVMQYIDLLAFYKMNTLHWHLTDDQGWRIQIDAYPELTEVGAWRTEKDGSRYGGYYSKEDIRKIIAYAASRYVTVVPEIEMPGHSTAAIAAYPWLSCTGHQIEVENEWGVFKDIYCAGNDSTYVFIENVLKEVCALFPSRLIHIGGDEVPHTRWEACPKCKQCMKSNTLNTPLELQAHFMERVGKILAKFDKTMIGWDEIMDGEIPDDACVQVWRSANGGVANSGHRIVMSPTSHCYFDYPLSNIDMEKVYQFDPLNGVADDKAHLVMGGECNLWSEHIWPETLDQKVFPRALAMAEVLWTYPVNRNYAAFTQRVQAHYPLLRRMEVEYGYPTTPAKLKSQTLPEGMRISVQESIEGIHVSCQSRPFDLPGQGKGSAHSYSDPVPSSQELVVNVPTEIKLVPQPGSGFSSGELPVGFFAPHMACGAPLAFNYDISPSYTGGGQTGLVNGRLGGTSFRDEGWQGVQGSDVEVIADLGSEQSVSYICSRWYHYTNAWIFRPESVNYFISPDGKNWEKLPEVTGIADIKAEGELILPAWINIGPKNARYVKMVAHSVGPCPEWHDAAGSSSWLFCDELIVK